MRSVNVFGDEAALDGDEPDGYRAGAIRVSALIGSGALAVKAIELPPGQSVCPYHYEYEEEWLLALDGAVEVRTPERTETLERGAAVCFPPGPAGAHKVTNAGSATVRVLMFSSAREPAVAVYPDSDKVGVWPGEPGDELMFRRADGGVGYWDGEP
ncbi:MAG TPA: cupin domain-containing protein [Solirubrobacteraceae bacterium]|nr:cupin domain-containing protein [Solirubrobacteraceae bacterium]